MQLGVNAFRSLQNSADLSAGGGTARAATPLVHDVYSPQAIPTRDGGRSQRGRIGEVIRWRVRVGGFRFWGPWAGLRTIGCRLGTTSVGLW